MTAIIVIAIIVIAIALIAAKRKRIAGKLQILNSVQDFSMDEIFISRDGNSGIAIDKDSKRICYVNEMNTPIIYPHTAIIESEILEDSQSVSKMSASRTAGGFVLGGLVGGIAGAVVGGLSGRSTSSSEVKQITLKFRINDLHTPSLTILFMNELTHVKTKGLQGVTYREASKKANHWHDLLSVLINSADKEVQEKLVQGQNNLIQAVTNSNQNQIPISNNLLADELTKLHSLKERGILTEDEYNAQKIKLLN